MLATIVGGICFVLGFLWAYLNHRAQLCHFTRVAWHGHGIQIFGAHYWLWPKDDGRQLIDDAMMWRRHQRQEGEAPVLKGDGEGAPPPEEEWVKRYDDCIGDAMTKVPASSHPITAKTRAWIRKIHGLAPIAGG